MNDQEIWECIAGVRGFKSPSNSPVATLNHFLGVSVPRKLPDNPITAVNRHLGVFVPQTSKKEIMSNIENGAPVASEVPLHKVTPTGPIGVHDAFASINDLKEELKVANKKIDHLTKTVETLNKCHHKRLLDLEDDLLDALERQRRMERQDYRLHDRDTRRDDRGYRDRDYRDNRDRDYRDRRDDHRDRCDDRGCRDDRREHGRVYREQVGVPQYPQAISYKEHLDMALDFYINDIAELPGSFKDSVRKILTAKFLELANQYKVESSSPVNSTKRVVGNIVHPED